MNLRIYCQNSSSCIVLVFTSQSNMVIESGIHSSLHSICHHQIVLAKFNLKICYQPPYSRKVWYYKEGKTDLIRRGLNDFNWDRAFSNKNVNEEVCIFNKSVLNILGNFIPHENTIYDDKNPTWFNSRLSLFYMPKRKFSKIIRKNENNYLTS